ncbi:MAG: L,D-transpeptidase [Deltaproteobacteria bacterium]|nr:L,D-transpeptidase [Deltaproteobacteria bacterium]
MAATGVADYFLSEVFAEPRMAARIIGWVQTGSELELGARLEGHRGGGCPQGWWPLADGRGYMCGGRGLQVGKKTRPTRRGTAIARRGELVPYKYALIHAQSGSPRYARRPTEEEQSAKEALGPAGVDGGLVSGFMRRGFMVSVRGVAGRQPRAFWSCVRGGYVRYDHGYTLRPRPFRGVAAGPITLPIAFVTAYRPKRYREAAGALVEDGESERLVHFALAGERTVGGEPVLAAPDGALFKRGDCSLVRLPPRPPDLAAAERWIHVSLADQALVAMEGDRAVYATVVSTGQPTPGRRTRPGTFRIESKHVSATMDDDSAGDTYSIEDVPWTMFYDHSYALHGAFWHERFGHPQSHGCVNLSAADARWLFEWAGPTLPPGWYGMVATSRNPGSRVVIQ